MSKRLSTINKNILKVCLLLLSGLFVYFVFVPFLYVLISSSWGPLSEFFNNTVSEHTTSVSDQRNEATPSLNTATLDVKSQLLPLSKESEIDGNCTVDKVKTKAERCIFNKYILLKGSGDGYSDVMQLSDALSKTGWEIDDTGRLYLQDFQETYFSLYSQTPYVYNSGVFMTKKIDGKSISLTTRFISVYDQVSGLPNSDAFAENENERSLLNKKIYNIQVTLTYDISLDI